MDFKKEQLAKLSRGFTKADMQGTQLENYSRRPRIARSIERYDISSIAAKIEEDYRRKVAYRRAYYEEFVYMYVTPERYVEIPKESYDLMIDLGCFPSNWMLLRGKRGELLAFIKEKGLIK